jgi:glycosyltransferase involved in cell wall biosynthesis
MKTHVWAPGEGHASKRVRESGLAVQYYDGDGVFSRSRIRTTAANLAIAARLRGMGESLIHIHSPYAYGALRHGFRLAGAKRVLHIHLDFDADALRWALKTPPDLIITCAKFLTETAHNALPINARQRIRIEAVSNAVDLERFKPGDKRAAKQRLGAPHDRPLLLMMANLAPHKGQETAIRAVARLRQGGIHAQLWLAGADRSPKQACEPHLRGLVSALSLDDYVSFLGFRTDGPELLQAADVVLLPSTSEGLPLTLLEAQACCVPVIAAPTAGIPEIVADGETGFLVAAEDSDGYAARIESLLARPDLARQIVERAAARCRAEHSWETYRRRVFDLYSQVCAN